MARGERTYLDYNATAPIRPQAAEAVVRAFDLAGNPSSVHGEGRAARSLLEASRDEVAALVGARPQQVVFTGGGSEAANLVLSPAFRRGGRDEAGPDWLFAGATEHPCVLEGHRFPAERVARSPVGRDGIVDLDWLERQLEATGAPALVSIQLANNETGVVQPVAEAARLVHARGGLVHTDAVQAVGKIPVDIAVLGVDALTLSAHKLGGPTGVGALVLASDALTIDPLVRGGGQERGRRAGTENLLGIAGFGAAARVARDDLAGEAARLRALRTEFEAVLTRFRPDLRIFGAGVERLPNTVAFALPGVRAETALIAFDLAGVALSSGSACSSGKVRRSHVLDAMGVEPALAEGAIRLSFGWKTAAEDVNRFAAACETVFATLYHRKARAA